MEDLRLEASPLSAGTCSSSTALDRESRIPERKGGKRLVGGLGGTPHEPARWSTTGGDWKFAYYPFWENDKIMRSYCTNQIDRHRHMAAEREGLAEQCIFLYPPVLRWWRDRGVVISPSGKRCSFSGLNPGILGVSVWRSPRGKLRCLRLWNKRLQLYAESGVRSLENLECRLWRA